MTRFKGFVGQSYIGDSYRSARQECVNIYPKLEESGEKREGEVAALVGTPGYKRIRVFDQRIRKLYVATNGDLFIFAGERIFRTRDLQSYKEIGRLETNGRIDVADDGVTMVISEERHGYTHLLRAGIIKPLTEWPGVVSSLQFLNKKFYYAEKGRDIIHQSDAGTAAEINDFSTVESKPDPILATAVLRGEFLAFGENSLEVLSDEGDNLVRTSHGRFEIGIAARDSVVKIGEVVLWIGRDDAGGISVYITNGGNPQKVSNNYIDRIFRDYQNLSLATAWGYREDGHSFYLINIPGSNTTWVYNVEVGMWHERRYGENQRDIIEQGVYALGKYLVADYRTGILYEMSSDIGEHDGKEITRIRTTPHVTNALKRVTHGDVQIDAEVGHNSTFIDRQQEFDPLRILSADNAPEGIESRPGGPLLLISPLGREKFEQESRITLEWSNDGGFNWSKGRTSTMGKRGETKKRIIFRRLGMARDRVYRTKIFSKGKVVILGAELNAK